MENQGTLFDQSYLQLLSRALESDGLLTGIELTFPSILDVFPTVGVTSVVPFAITPVMGMDFPGLRSGTNNNSAIHASSSFGDLHMHSDSKGFVHSHLWIHESSYRSFPGAAIWASTLLLTHLAYMKQRPGPMRVFVGELRLRDDGEKKFAMGLLVDYPPSKLQNRVRRQRDSVAMPGALTRKPFDLIEELRLVVATETLRRAGFTVKSPVEPEFQHSLSRDFRLLLNYPSVVGDTEDPAIKLLLHRGKSHASKDRRT